MFPSSEKVKSTAKTQLKNNWVSAILVAVIFILMLYFAVILFEIIYSLLVGNGRSSVMGMTMCVFCTAVSLIVVFPLYQGVLRWFWFLGLNKPLPLGELFYYFSSRELFLKTMRLHILLTARCIITATLCSVPSFFLKVFPFREFGMPDSILSLIEKVSVVLLLIGLGVSVVILFKYFIAPMLLTVNEDAQPEEIVVIAKQLSLSVKTCLRFILSFVGWILLSFLGIPLVYTVPYFFMSYAVFVRFSVTNHRCRMAELGVPPMI